MRCARGPAGQTPRACRGPVAIWKTRRDPGRRNIGLSRRLKVAPDRGPALSAALLDLGHFVL